MTSERGMIEAAAEVEPLLIYVRANGASTPPLLMNPVPTWTVRFFTKVGQQSLYVQLPAPVEAYRSLDGARLDPDAILRELGLLPYEMIELRSAAPNTDSSRA